MRAAGLSAQRDPPTGRDSDYPLRPPVAVRRPAMIHRWSRLSFIHRPLAPQALQPLLPDDLRIDTFEGVAWIGLVPFDCEITLPRVRPVPWASRFEEMNVRTYVRGPDGVPGIYFLSLDAARLGAVLIARATYRLNYRWAKMRFARVGDIVTYESRRRWPSVERVGGRIAVELEDPVTLADLSDLERFLTARWAFYSVLGRGLARAYVEHDPWALWRARLLHLDETLNRGLGIERFDAPPLIHFSDCVEVRMGWPQVLERRKGAKRPPSPLLVLGEDN